MINSNDEISGSDLLVEERRAMYVAELHNKIAELIEENEELQERIEQLEDYADFDEPSLSTL